MTASLVVVPLTVSAKPSIGAGSSAVAGTGSASGGKCEPAGIEILPKWHKYIKKEVTADGCDLKFNFPSDIGLVILAVVEILLRISTMVAVAFVIVGGFQFITTQGEPEKAKNARTTIMNAAIGLIIAIFATGIVAFIGKQLTS